MRNNKSNKAIVLDFWKRVIGQREINIAAQFISEKYIQHSAGVKDGRDGLLESLELLKKMPRSETSAIPSMFVMADDEYVALYMIIEMSGKKMALVDMVRIENGLFAEHWDAVQNIHLESDMRNLTVPHNNESPDHLTAKNKAFVKHFTQYCLVERQLDKINEFVSEGLIEHSEDCGVLTMFSTEDYSIERVYRIIGEGNMVLVQSKGTILLKPCVFYDIYCISENKIVEHWNVRQLVPTKLLHNNGML